MTKKNYEELGFAKVDHHRIKRKGFPEVIYGQGKTPEQIVKIAKSIAGKKQNVLITRTDKKVYLAVKKIFNIARFYEMARIIIVKKKVGNKKRKIENRIAIITAGTSDIPVAEEAAVTAEFFGMKVQRFYDVGVAGIHRLMRNIAAIRKAKVVIVVAGMEGALPSVVGGLVNKPVIAVPTSVGYGASFKGLSALLTMLNTCAPGVAVVNIDNGFGAAVVAQSILQLLN